MANVPQFLGPDSVLREELTFTTTRPSRFFTGTIDANTVDLQVSIRGEAFTSDPDLVTFEGTSFTIPNPSSFTEGLDLLGGLNTIQVRAVDTSGSVSAPATARVTLVQEAELGLVVTPPSNISVERLDTTVRVTVEGVDDENFQGIHFYGSPFPGGGTEGFLPLNVNLITDFASRDEETTLAVLPVDADIILGPDSEHAADPLFVSVVGTQQDEDENVLQTDFNEVLEIPEDVERIRYNFTVSQVRRVSLFSFEHDRAGGPTSPTPTIPTSAFSALPPSDPVYYVATAVFFDPIDQVELESPFSPEVLASPLRVTTVIGGLPVVSRDQILNEITQSINRAQPELNIMPGAVVRDTVVDPISTEAQRIRFVMDFLHRAHSFSDLLRIDDPALSGDSVAVSQSRYKLSLRQAFHLIQDSDVQDVIDQAFDSKAAAYGVTRSPGDRAVGESTFFTTRRPDASIPIPIGTTVSGGGRQFRTTSAAEITLENIASFFTGTTGRFAVRVPLQAVDPGAGGNVGPGQIRTIVSGLTGLSVINEGRTFGGTDRESNRDLAVRAQNALASVDSGTLAGYLQVAAGTPGVTEVRVVESGDVLMQRDFDEVSMVHRGGKVDIWVRGTQVNTITDAFAFRFEIAQNVVFELIDDPLALRFRALSADLSPLNPIIEMLDVPSFGFGMRNDSTGEDFDLTDVVVESYNTIALSTVVPQPTIGITDVVRGDFRFRTSDSFVFPRQPVRRINSLTGSVTGLVDETAYVLNRLADPLREGRSTRAGDNLQVIDSQVSGVVIPSGTPIAVTDENHVIIGQTIEYLENLGINPLTIGVFNVDRTVEFVGPFDPAGSNDYTIIEGDERTPVGIRRTEGGTITSGQEVLVDYEHDENFVVSYDTNFLVQAVQDAVDGSRHITADVLAKESILVRSNLASTILLRRGESPGTVDTRVRTNLENFLRGLGLGDPLRPSDVVGVKEGTQGVSHVILPMTTMVRDVDSLILREALVSEQDQDITLVTEWSQEAVLVYLLEDALANATTNGGGPDTEHRGVFEDEVGLILQTVQPEVLGEGPGRCFIIGNAGLSIPGISDDQTLTDQGFETDQEISDQRKLLTSNRILVSVSVGGSPLNHDYTVTYLVGEDAGVKSLEPGPAESLTLGDLVFTYDEDRV
jgi:hypothetical protein